MQVTANGLGEGQVMVQFEEVATKGDSPITAVGFLYALVEQDRTWLSVSSPIDVQIQRAIALSSGASGTMLRSSASSDLTTAIERIVTAHVPTDTTPHRQQELTPQERRLQKSFESVLPQSGRSEAQAIGPAAAVTITVQGQAKWTDSAGNTHGIPMATVEIRDNDLIGSELITTVTTDTAGNYSATFTHDDGIGQGNPDIFVRVLARSPVADIKPDTFFASTYQLESAVQNEVPGGSTLTINLTAGNSNDNETVFSVHHALVVIGGYAGNLAGVMPSQITTRFPTTQHTSLFDGSELHILRLDRWDWDVIHHEYGHYFMDIHKFEDNPGGSHSSSQNLAQSRGSKDIGIRLAWGEGWPTYFGTSGQQAMGAASLGIPNVGDVSYTDTEDFKPPLSNNLETSTGLGEDNELSVSAVLWDLFDNASDGEDTISLGDKFLFNTIKAAVAKTVGAAWEAIAATRDTRNKTLVGAVFGQSKIAPVLKEPADKIKLKASDPPPTFRWDKNGGGAPNPLNDFTIKFYKNDFSSVVFQKDLGNTDNYTPTPAELGAIMSGNTEIQWVVEGRNTSAPATPGGSLGKYWSGSRSLGGVSIAFVIDDTGSMTEEIGSVRNALQAFIDSVAAGLPPGADSPTIQLITFKDDVTLRLTSSDLNAVRGAVAGLVADGGGDCPEFSAQALQFAAGNIAPGGTILLATDASSQPGVDIGTVIADLRAKGVTVNTILSGDCTDDISASSLRLVSQQSGNELLKSGPQNDTGHTNGFDKPGDEDPPHGPIDDPGQSPLDEHGDTPATATPIPVDGTPVRGLIGLDSDTSDVLSFVLEAGKTYSLQLQMESGYYVGFTLLDRNGLDFLDSGFAFDPSLPVQIVFTPSESGRYFLQVTAYYSIPSSYWVAVKEDPFATLDTAVELFSTISAQTGGIFVVHDEVNFGQTTEYEAALFNIMMSTIGSAVLSSNPDKLPQSATLALNLNGRNTNWRNNSSVSFSGTGISVLSLTANSATSLTALVQLDPAAPLGFYSVTVQTPLGSATETASGSNVVEVTPAITVPTLLSVEPSEASQGSLATVTVRGLNTAWNAGSTLSLGPGVTVQALSVISPTLMQASLAVAPDAAIAFRTAEVVTPGAGTQSKSRALFINNGVATVPQVTNVIPAEGTTGQILDVAITGRDTNFQNGVTTASFGDGIEVLALAVIDAHSATVRIRIASNAAPGFRSVSLTTGSETAVLLNGFFVNAAAMPGDADRDGDIDNSDLQLVLAVRNTTVGAGDPRDLNGDGVVTVRDARLLILACTRPNCATQ